MAHLLELLRRYGPVGTVTRTLADPSRAYRYLRRSDTGRVLPKHTVERPPRLTEVVEFVDDLNVGASRREVRDVWIELCDDATFHSEVGSAVARTTAGPDKFYHNWRDVLYVLARVTGPDRIVETGVRGGLSSAYLLAALDREGHGHLVSIDIGDTSLLPDNVDGAEPGWIVPERLRSRWDRRITDAATELPAALDERTGIFLSDVPNEILREELSVAATELRPGSVVVTCTPRGSEAEAVWREFADGALRATATATRWESADGGSDLRAGVLAERPTVPDP